MNKTEFLQSIFDRIKPTEEYYHEFTVEYKPRKGWYLIPTEARWFCDEGEFIGENYEEIIKYNLLERLCKTIF
jgi:hypothetical protein